MEADKIMLPDTKNAPPAATVQAYKAGTAVPRPPDSKKVAAGWWLAAIVSVAAAAVVSVVVARGTNANTAHRAAAAAAALLVVAALAVLAQVILLWYQSRMISATGAAPAEPTLAFRRRGLKAAVIGQDGRASTSKTQVVLWTGAVVWALVDLLLLARAYPVGNLFTNAVTKNWRPEYLVLLGLPVAAATTAKAVVAGSNSGHGPIAASSSSAMADSLNLDRIYVRDPVPSGVWGLVAGVAELLTGDDGAVAWADLQYVVFTTITLVYFAIQLLARPADGLPPVPAALLTLMGVSATAYAANKIVNTQAAVVPSGADSALEEAISAPMSQGLGRKPRGTSAPRHDPLRSSRRSGESRGPRTPETGRSVPLSRGKSTIAKLANNRHIGACESLRYLFNWSLRVMALSGIGLVPGRAGRRWQCRHRPLSGRGWCRAACPESRLAGRTGR